MHHVQPDAVHLMELAVEGDFLHGQQLAQHGDGLAHGQQRLAALDAHLAGQRVPPRADAADHPVRRQVVQGQEGGGQQADVAGPVVDDAAADLELGGVGGEGSHGHDGVAHQAALGLPHRLEALGLGVLGQLDAFR